MAVKPGKGNFWRNLLIWSAAAVVLLAALAVGLRYWITTDSGRGFLVSMIDGRRTGPLGVIRISGLTGDPLTSAMAADIAFVDDTGVWLRVRDAKLVWQPFDLLGGSLDIDTAEIRQAEVLRRPNVTPRPTRGGDINLGVRLNDFRIGDLQLAAGVAGPAARYSVDGGASRMKSGDGFLKLGVTPLEGPDDRAMAEVEWTSEGDISGSIDISGPAGGVISNLIAAPENAAVTFRATVQGRLDAFTADADLEFADEPVVELTASRAGEAARVDATLQPGAWPLLADIAERTGGPVTLSATALIRAEDTIPATLLVQAPAGRLELAGDIGSTTFMPAGVLQLTATGIDLAMVASPLSGMLDGAGPLTIDEGGITWTPEAVVENLRYPSGTAQRLTAPVEISWRNSLITWLTTEAVVEGWRLADMPSMPAARYELATRGEVDLATNRVEVQQAQVRGNRADGSGRGFYSIGDGEFAFEGSGRLANLSDLSNLTGSVRGQWTVRRANDTSPIRITSDVSGRNVGSESELLDQLIGGEPRLVVSAVAHNGRFLVESGRVDARGVTARLEGRVAPSGAVTGRARASLVRPLNAGAVNLTSVQVTADITGTMSRPVIAARIQDGAASLSGVDLTDIAANIDLVLADDITAALDLTGGIDGQPLQVTARMRESDGVYRFPVAQGKFGGLNLVSRDLAISGEGLSTQLSAEGSLAGLAGLQRGRVSANGSFSADEAGQAFTLTAQGADIRTEGGIRLDAVTANLSGTPQEFSGDGRVRGLAGAAINLGWDASASQNDDGWSGTVSLDGTVDELPVSTPQDLSWSTSTAGWSVSGVLAALGGRINAALETQNGASSARAEIADVNLRAVSRLLRQSPFSGQLSGQLAFTNSGGAGAAGSFSMTATDVNPDGVTDDPVTISASGRLERGALNLLMAGEGQGFELRGEGSLPVIANEGFDLALSRERPVSGDLLLQGRAGPLWALFGPEGQSLRGRVETRATVAGTLAAPALDGEFQLIDAAYDHGETGLRLRDINMTGEFDQTSARVASLTATDGNGGRLTAEGSLAWAGEVDGGLTFTAANLRALGREDRFAIVSGSGSVDIDPEAVVISGDFDVQQARISVEQPVSASIPTLPIVRRVNFANGQNTGEITAPEPARPVRLDVTVTAPRRIVIFGRGLDTEWGVDFDVTGTVANPSIAGSATLVRGTLDLAGERFAFDTGSITLTGPIRTARIDIAATRRAADIEARVRIAGTPVDPEFVLESTPVLPQDEILARVLFNRAASELSALEAAQLAAALTQLAGGQAAFDPAGLLREATGLDRVSIGAEGDAASVAAGKYIADNVYLQVGAGGEGGVGAEVEWEPADNVSIISSAQGNGDTKIALRWKRDY